MLHLTQPALRRLRRIEGMSWRYFATIAANFIFVAALIRYGLNLFAEYHARGKWAKNVTGLLGGLGLMALAAALLFTPANAEVIVVMARAGASRIFLWISSALLLSAIAAFGLITYWKPLRLLHEQRIERDLHGELPKIP